MSDTTPARPSAVYEQNRRSWNAVTSAHNSHKRDQAGFLRGGGSTLFPEELALLGPIEGLRLAHLQCNCGQDSLSLAARGAQVVGVDISDEAIGFARTLSAEAGIAARFVRSEIYQWLDQAAAQSDRYDRVFASYGALPWLDDVPRWARGVAEILAPGGKLVVLEFHPAAWSYDAQGRAVEPYFIEGPIEEREGVRDYVGRSGDDLLPMGRAEQGVPGFENPEPAFAFQYTVGQLVTALADASLFIERLSEYPYANGCMLFEGMRALGDRRYGMPEGAADMPLMLGVVATHR